MPAGRPRKYRESMAEDIVGLARDGNTMVAISDMWDTTDNQLRDWATDGLHEEFSAAYKRARNAFNAYMLKKMEEGLFESKDKRLNKVAAACLLAHGGIPMEERMISVPGIDSDDPKVRVKGVLSLIKQTKLTAKEARDLLETLGIATKIEQVADLEQEIDNLKIQLNSLTSTVKV